jgi:hypothetical protein
MSTPPGGRLSFSNPATAAWATASRPISGFERACSWASSFRNPSSAHVIIYPLSPREVGWIVGRRAGPKARDGKAWIQL